MSARDAMAAMLDELMGPKRNLDLGTDITVRYDDPDICKYYIVGFCPHDMFTNTKADLGICPKVHDDKLKAGYATSSAFEKMGFEQEFLRFLIKLEDDNQRRIRRNKEKLRANDEYGQKKDEERIAKYKAELAQIDEDIKKVIKAAEESGNRGDVTTTLELVKQSEILELSRTSILAKMEEPAVAAVAPALAPLLTDSENRQKDVCETCGSMLIRNDAQCRVEEHLMGKMHMGFAKIQVTIKEFKEKFAKLEEEREKEREERRKEREKERESDKDRRGGERRERGDRDRSDRDRDRERDRDHRRRDRSRDRSRDRRDRSRDRSRRDDRDRRHSRR